MPRFNTAKILNNNNNNNNIDIQCVQDEEIELDL